MWSKRLDTPINNWPSNKKNIFTAISGERDWIMDKVDKFFDPKKEERISTIEKFFWNNKDLPSKAIYKIFRGLSHFPSISQDSIFEEGFIKFIHDDSNFVNLLKKVYSKNFSIIVDKIDLKDLTIKKINEYKKIKYDISNDKIEGQKKKIKKEMMDNAEGDYNNMLSTFVGVMTGAMVGGPTGTIKTIIGSYSIWEAFIGAYNPADNSTALPTTDAPSNTENEISDPTANSAVLPTIDTPWTTNWRSINKAVNQTLDNMNTNENAEKFLQGLAVNIQSHKDYQNLRKLLDTKWAEHMKNEHIIAFYISTQTDIYNKLPDKIKELVNKNSEDVRDYLLKQFYYDQCFMKREEWHFSREEIGNIIINVNLTIKAAWDMWEAAGTDFTQLRNNIQSLMNEDTIKILSMLSSDSWIDYLSNKMQEYLVDNSIDENKKIWVAMLFASSIRPPMDIKSHSDLMDFIRAVNGDGTSKYYMHLNNFISQRDKRDEEWEYNYALNSLINRYERAQALARSRRFYGDTIINFSGAGNNSQDQSWLEVASRIKNIDKKLNQYKLKSNLDEHEEAALKYTAFETTFNNIFNLNDTIIQKLAGLDIDLHSELVNYWIYDQNNNRFNKEARDNFVSDKLWNNLLTPEEIQELWNSIESLPSEVQKNYEILCGNFDADQDSFEKISKIYALGEIIDNIKTLFAGLNSKKLWDFMSLQLDENEPADIKGDFLFLKWKINWTETNIKYDLRTWKLYMNSFTSQSFNPPKIIVWNTEPNTEIGDLGSFEDAISNLNSPFQIQNNEDNDMSDTWDNHLWDISEDDNTSKQDTEKLIKNKLNKDLKDIWRIVKEKAWEQGKENNVIDDLLKTFNILPDSWEPKGIEFMGWSNLFTLLESIKNTNNEDDLLEFSNQMKELMSLCELSRWKNNENPQKPEFTSITIFDIGEDNATTDIISLQKANKSFFLDKSWEKDKLKSSQSHFDSSIQLSFANIIVQKCCRNTWSWRKIATSEMKSFVKSIKDGIADIKSDKEKILAYETMFDEDVNLD